MHHTIAEQIADLQRMATHAERVARTFQQRALDYLRVGDGIEANHWHRLADEARAAAADYRLRIAALENSEDIEEAEARTGEGAGQVLPKAPPTQSSGASSATKAYHETIRRASPE